MMLSIGFTAGPRRPSVNALHSSVNRVTVTLTTDMNPKGVFTMKNEQQ